MRNIALLLTMVLGTIVCQAQTSTITTAQPQPDTSAVKAQVNAVLLIYYDLKNALTKDDGKTASAKATELLAALGKVDTSAMIAGQTAEYTLLQANIKSAAEQIAATSQVGRQREHLDMLSDNIWLLVKSFDANEQPAYRQYCPMVKKYWVSGEKAVKNPYYGQQMLTCGSVKEKLD